MRNSRERVTAALMSILFLAIVCTATLNVEASPLQWSLEKVDETGNVGGYTSIALDSNDYPHISYHKFGDGDLKYAWWNGSAWNITTVDSGDYYYVGEYTSIALDSNDYPHISYYDYTNSTLKYAHWNGSAWNTTYVDLTGGVGAFSSIALDSNDHPHISYAHHNYPLKYAHWNGSAWNIASVGSLVVGGGCSIAVDSNDHPHISYQYRTNDDLKYAWWNGSAWNIEKVDEAGNVGEFTSIAIDTDDNPHISYQDITNHNLKYAWWTGSTWNITTVHASPTQNIGHHTSLALGSDGHRHISYWSLSTGDLNYATTSDMIPPNIGNVSQNPPENNVLPTDEVKVNATVTDDLSGVKQVILNYTNGNGTWIIVGMTNLEANIWNATIPAFPFNTNVTYVVMAEDNANNTITTENTGYEYEYHVIPEFPAFHIMALFAIATLLAVITYIRKQST